MMEGRAKVSHPSLWPLAIALYSAWLGSLEAVRPTGWWEVRWVREGGRLGEVSRGHGRKWTAPCGRAPSAGDVLYLGCIYTPAFTLGHRSAYGTT